MANLSRAKLQALEVLRAHGVSQPPVDVRAIAENEGVHVVFQELEDQISGVFVQNGDVATIGVNAIHPPIRQRFTLAHEFAHYALHRPTSQALGPTAVFVDEAKTMVRFRAEDNSSPQDLEANTFAAALLMPEPFLKNDLRDNVIDANDDTAMRRLAKRYGVSQQALTIRLMDLGFIAGIRPGA